MLEAKADPNQKDATGVSAFTYCLGRAEGADLEVIDLMIKHNADVHARCNAGLTPLMRAAMRCNGPVVESLINGGARIADKVNTGVCI